VMPVWRKDIKTLWAAWHLRRQRLDDSRTSLQTKVCSWQI
jgi:hypothetical protein